MEEDASIFRSHILAREARSGVRDVALRRQYNHLLRLRGAGQQDCEDPAYDKSVSYTVANPCMRGKQKEMRSNVNVGDHYVSGHKLYVKRSRKDGADRYIGPWPASASPGSAGTGSPGQAAAPAPAPAPAPASAAVDGRTVEELLGANTRLREIAHKIHFDTEEKSTPFTVDELKGYMDKYQDLKASIDARNKLLGDGATNVAQQCARIRQQEVCDHDTNGKCSYDTRLFRTGCKERRLVMDKKKNPRGQLTGTQSRWNVWGVPLGPSSNRAKRSMMKKPYKLVRALYAIKELTLRSDGRGFFLPANQDPSAHGAGKSSFDTVFKGLQHAMSNWTADDFERMYQKIEWRE